MSDDIRSWTLVDELVTLRAEVATLRKDKERLDWLDENLLAHDTVVTFGYEVELGKLREAIDAAKDQFSIRRKTVHDELL